MVCFRNKREVELSVLLLLVVTNKTTLNLFVVDNLVHLNGHVVDFVVDRNFGFVALSESPRVDKVKNGSAILITLQEVFRLVFRANKNHAKVIALETSVDMKLEFIRTSGQAHGSPGLALIHASD